jgi:predicted metal-dependent phosphoesterase TrpH
LRLDLHNHTSCSYDGFNRLVDYERAYRRGAFDVVAITDHETVEGALRLRQRASFPVIVGQEIKTGEGEVIGLFAERPVPPNLGAEETIARIKGQGGLVYVPHPFLRWIAQSLGKATLLRVLPGVDIVEAHNGLVFHSGPNEEAQAFAARLQLRTGAGSDAHVPVEIGTAWVEVPGLTEPPLSPAALLAALDRGRVAAGPTPPMWRRVGQRVTGLAQRELGRRR